ncbi:Putative calcium-transporting ATPase 13, plasma membrane-type [Morus notabilis]|uniref:Putative calcium-transporting ATPase 13, plasma membrane-type n=1 Tax=Morus notabilis TaxID=981085 RepID=W9SM37_9ROSA|nr:Putative calcium-transporting ATPase 13, plasma membrane-type [Morus notabilis]
MKANNAMALKLTACPLIGCATTICIDKTGKITANQMNVCKFWLGKEHVAQDMRSCYYDAFGDAKDLSCVEKMEFEQVIWDMADRRLRNEILIEDGLILLGVMGIHDPCRPGIKEAVWDFHNAGVNIKMITGDNIFTAMAIARECGILGASDDLSSGAVYRRHGVSKLL